MIMTDGKCPVCGVVPYVRRRRDNPHFYCYRCMRAYHLDSGKWKANWAWVSPTTMTDMGRVAGQFRPDIDRHMDKTDTGASC